MNQDNQGKLISHLQRIEDMWQKLIYVKWSQESFNLLALLARELEQLARSHGDEILTGLASQLRNHLGGCIAARRVPKEAERERLVILLDQLRQNLASADGKTKFDTTKPLLTAATELFVLDAGNTRQLIPKLKDAGFQVRHLRTVAEVQEALADSLPLAVIIDVDFPDEPLSGIGMIAEMRTLRRLSAPIFFLAERDDITARLEAVRAGGMGYFNKLVDIPALLEKLKNGSLQQPPQSPDRVLIVDDSFADARDMANMLESNGVIVQIVTQPMQVIQDIYRFQPDLLLLDLELSEINGLELAQALSQHTACEVMPMLLFASQSYIGRNLSRLEVEGATLLSKPLVPDYLCWAVIQRLHKARALRLKLNALRDQDVISGLYNRRFFLAQLERGVAALGLGARSVGIIFIMLDNLRAIRDSTDVVVADELVEQAAGRLRKVLGRRHTAARFGDAIFAVMMQDVHKEGLLAAARALRDGLETGVYEIGLHSLLLRVSIGISSAADDKNGFLTLIQQADMACNLARETKGERIYVHHDIYANRDEEEFQRQRLLKEIEEAFNQQRMRLMFQPVISLRGDQGERYEVLLRINNLEDRELLPETVFGITQRHPLGVTLDRWVIAQSVFLLGESKEKAATTTLFIKMLPVTLQDESLATWLDKRLKEAEVSARNIVFQVSQASAERDLRDLFRFLKGVKSLGCRFCLDHFKVAPNSLALLKNLGADYVKLDMFFVQGLAGDESKQEQLKELIEGLAVLGVPAIVGGIEDLQALPMLWSYGINYVQGFFLQPPHEEMSYDFASGAI